MRSRSDLGALVRLTHPFPLRLPRALRGLRCVCVGAVAANAAVFAARSPGPRLERPDGIRPAGERCRPTCAGRDAVAQPPVDFDAFWRTKTQQLEQVPVNPRLVELASKRPGVRYWQVRLNNIAGSHVHGQLARPATGDELPALLILPHAGVDGLQQSGVTSRAAEGWLTLSILPHDLPVDESPQFSAAQDAGPRKDYWAIGDDDADSSYHLRMYLSCLRAVDYLQSRPDWNGRTLVVIGDGPGGQQALALAGLRPRVVSAVLALVRSAGDTVARESGQAPGFPGGSSQTAGKNPARVRDTSRYYETANFAHWIRCPVLIGLGLPEEELSPPASVLAIANNITSPKEVVIVAQPRRPNEDASPDQFVQQRDQEWLPALRQGRRPPASAMFRRAADRSWPTPLANSEVR